MKVFSLLTPTKPEFDNTVKKILGSKKGYENIIEKIKDIIGKWITKLLEKIVSRATAETISNKASTIILVIALILVITIIIIIALKIIKTIDKKSSVKEILGEIIDDKTTPEGLRRKAEGYLNQGEYRQGVRYSFVALLLLMHNNNLLYLEDAKTNKEIISMLEDSGFRGIKEFKELVSLFNSIWYGHKNLNEDTCNLWQQDMTRLWNEVLNIEAKK